MENDKFNFLYVTLIATVGAQNTAKYIVAIAAYGGKSSGKFMTFGFLEHASRR